MSSLVLAAELLLLYRSASDSKVSFLNAYQDLTGHGCLFCKQ